MSNTKLNCTSINCPERTGGECNAYLEVPTLEELKIKLDDYRQNQQVLDPEISKAISDNLMELF